MGSERVRDSEPRAVYPETWLPSKWSKWTVAGARESQDGVLDC